MQELEFRRQFLLTQNNSIKLPSFWEHKKILSSGQEWNLFCHPDLEVTELSEKSKKLILLGYFLDPFRTGDDNLAILNNLVKYNDWSEIIENTHRLNGRFLLLYVTDKEFKIINDVSAFRELHYKTESTGIHCGSTADIIKEYIGVEKSEDADLHNFFNSEDYIENDYTWIGYDTIFKDVSKLPPNHMLDLHQGSIDRFWPLVPFENRKANDITEESAQMLQGSIESIAKRYPVHLGVTAGWDTRIVLSASKSVKDQIFYYVNRPAGRNDDHPDIKVPRQLAEKLGFKLNIVDIEDSVNDEEFTKVFYKNNFRAHDLHLSVFYHGYKQGFENTITVNGILAEGTARKYFYSPVKQKKLNGEITSFTTHFGRNKYAVRILNEWVEKNKALCARIGIDLIDFYTVEQDAPNWCSLSASEQDIVREEMRPLNSRYLIELLWSLPDHHRFKYNPKIYRSIINHLWKEAMEVPINPSTHSTVFKVLGVMKLDRLLFKLYQYFRYLKFRSSK